MNEHENQKIIFKWAEKYPEIHRVMFAVPNGGLRNLSVAAKMKQEGVKAGVPDFQLCKSRNGYHGLFIELKTESGKVSAVQKSWHENLRAEGYCVEVCYGYKSAISIIKSYMGMEDDV